MSWIADIAKINGPRYLAVSSAIALAIDNGKLPAGSQLPPQRDLASQLGVTVGTIGRAYALLKKRGLIVGETGSGTFVQAKPEGGERTIPRVVPAPDTIDMISVQLPTGELAPALARAFMQIAESSNVLPLHRYPSESGALSHRTAGARWISRVGFEVPPDRVLLSAGAHQAICAAFSAFCDHGDQVLCEAMTYSGVRAIAAMQGLTLKAVTVDDQGIVPEALEEACARSTARVLYLQPSVASPTTALMSKERRRRIAEIIRKKDLILIEDDAATSALRERPPPISSLIFERSCYITSLSKAISPALRIGYVAAGPRLLPDLTNRLQTMSLAVSPVIAEVAAIIIGDGTAEQIAAKNLQELRRRNGLAAELLQGHTYRAHQAAAFVWLTLPPYWDPLDFTAAAKHEGVSIIPANQFAVDRAHAARAVRVSLNPGGDHALLRKGFDILLDLLRANSRAHSLVI